MDCLNFQILTGSVRTCSKRWPTVLLQSVLAVARSGAAGANGGRCSRGACCSRRALPDPSTALIATAVRARVGSGSQFPGRQSGSLFQFVPTDEAPNVACVVAGPAFNCYVRDWFAARGGSEEVFRQLPLGSSTVHIVFGWSREWLCGGR